MQNVYESLIQVFATVELCAERGWQLPALILTYSAFDTMGWMAAPDPRAKVRGRFTAWAERYALPAVPRLRCTALELYAARCGVLHTFTADSDLSERGVRKLVYAWGPADLSDLERAAAIVGSGAWVAVHVSDLTAAVRLGAAQMFEDSGRDPILRARIESRGAAFFRSVGPAAFLGLRPPTGTS